MRFMMIIKSDPAAETGQPPPPEAFEAMGRYNDALAEAGVLRGAEGLAPSSKGALVAFENGRPKVIDGPFAEAKELVAGYWMLECGSLREAIDWAKQCPHPPVGEMELEIRQVFEADDFGEEFTPELRAQEERLRAEVEARR